MGRQPPFPSPRVPHPVGRCGAAGLAVLVASATLAAPLHAQSVAVRREAGPRSGALVVSGGSGYLVNPLMQDSAGPTDQQGQLAADLRMTRRWSRGTLVGALHGDLLRSRQLPNASRTAYGAAVAGVYRIAPTWEGRAQVAATSTFSPNVIVGGGASGAGDPIVDGSPLPSPPGTVPPPDVGGGSPGDPGLPAAPPPAASPPPTGGATALPLLPVIRTRSYNGGGGLTHRFTARVQGDIDASLTRIEFADPSLVGGQTWQAGARVGRTAPRGDRLFLSVESQRARTGALTLGTDGALLQWTSRDYRHVRFVLGGGVSLLSATGAGRRATPQALAQIAGRVWQGEWTARYARQVTPILGVADVITTDGFGAGYRRLLPGRLVAQLSADRVEVHAPNLEGARRASIMTASADVRRTLRGGVWLGGIGSFRSRTLLRTARAWDAALSAGYALTW